MVIGLKMAARGEGTDPAPRSPLFSTEGSNRECERRQPTGRQQKALTHFLVLCDSTAQPLTRPDFPLHHEGQCAQVSRSVALWTLDCRRNGGSDEEALVRTMLGRAHQSSGELPGWLGLLLSGQLTNQLIERSVLCSSTLLRWKWMSNFWSALTRTRALLRFPPPQSCILPFLPLTWLLDRRVLSADSGSHSKIKQRSLWHLQTCQQHKLGAGGMFPPARQHGVPLSLALIVLLRAAG